MGSDGIRRGRRAGRAQNLIRIRSPARRRPEPTARRTIMGVDSLCGWDNWFFSEIFAAALVGSRLVNDEGNAVVVREGENMCAELGPRESNGGSSVNVVV